MAKAKSLGVVGFFFVLVWPQLTVAQDTARVEVFGGYSYMPLHALPNLHGFGVSLTGNWNRLIGVTADFSGHFATEKPSSFVGPPTSFQSRSELRGYFLLFGPQLRIPTNHRLKPFGHALFGLSHRSLRVFTSSGSTQVLALDSDSGFSLALGGGLDIQVNGRLAIRALRADYLFSRLGNMNHHDFRYAGGIVFRWGTR